MTKRHDDDSDIPESVGMGVMRCPDCEAIHIGMLDDNGEAICEMTLNDDDVVRIALQLLMVVFPSMEARGLMERIDAVSGAHARRH